MNTKTYRWDAKDYAEHSKAQYAWALELMDKLNLKGNESLLDMGCGDGKITAAMASRIPMGRYGTVEEIAKTAGFLISDGAAYISGQNIRVDGSITRSV